MEPVETYFIIKNIPPIDLQKKDVSQMYGKQMTSQGKCLSSHSLGDGSESVQVMGIGNRRTCLPQSQF